jgi:Fic family protein
LFYLILIVSFDTIMKPPYTLTPSILTLLILISEKIGEISAAHLELPKAELRKANRIKTIQASLEIEGNTLSVEQVTALIDNKRVLAPKKDILEVQNAISLYKQLESLQAVSISSFLNAHAILMKGLIPAAGKFRTAGAGIVKGSDLTHLAPSAALVKGLMNDLFAYLKKDKDPILIRSCVFHYELEFIHPFVDGNGRMGRLWQTVLLGGQYPVFAYLPIEIIIKSKQKDYYRALSLSDKAGNSTLFIEFMLGVINEALQELLRAERQTLSAVDRIELYRQSNPGDSFTRRDYLAKYKEISTATASRDLKGAVEKKLLVKKGAKRTTVYRFAKRR